MSAESLAKLLQADPFTPLALAVVDGVSVQFASANAVWTLTPGEAAGILSWFGTEYAVHDLAETALSLERFGGINVVDLSRRLIDVRILAHIVDPREPRSGVDALLAKHGCSYDREEPAALTLALVRHLAPLISNTDLVAAEHRLARHAMGMRRRGMLLDVDATYRHDRELDREQENAAAICKQYGVGNPGSDAQAIASLRAGGTQVIGDSLSDSTLGQLPGRLPAAVLRYRRAGVQRRYTAAFLEHVAGDGRIRASINTLGAITARWSVTAPPLQQLPKRGSRIRELLIADPGSVVISADYDQIELRVLASFADVRGMKDAIARGVDLHTASAQQIFGVEFPTPEQRAIGKEINFAIVYGGGAQLVSERAQVDLITAQQALAAFHASFPEVAEFTAQVQHLAAKRGYVETPTTGRRIPVDPGRVATTAVNYLIQSTARDLLAAGISRAVQAGFAPYLTLAIHDELIAVVPSTVADEFLQKLQEVMAVDFNGVPITASGEVMGESWRGKD